MPAKTARLPAASRAALERRLWLALTMLAFVFLTSIVAQAQERVVRIGYQKYGTLALLKGKGALEPKLQAMEHRVAWAEFPAAPRILEALNAGAIDFGSTGEAPPIFAQAAAGSRLLSVAHEPVAPLGEAILVLNASTPCFEARRDAASVPPMASVLDGAFDRIPGDAAVGPAATM